MSCEFFVHSSQLITRSLSALGIVAASFAGGRRMTEVGGGGGFWRRMMEAEADDGCWRRILEVG